MTRLHSIGLTGLETGRFELRLDGSLVEGVTRVRLEMKLGAWPRLEVELLGGGVVFADADGPVDVVVKGAVDGGEELGRGPGLAAGWE